MADYIRREDYCEENCGKENREGYKTCTNCGMLNVPSADAQPVKHGKWDGYICSECNVCADYFISGDFYFDEKPTFCPNCGARMDGDPE
jgi:hypothetical protein